MCHNTKFFNITVDVVINFCAQYLYRVNLRVIVNSKRCTKCGMTTTCGILFLMFDEVGNVSLWNYASNSVSLKCYKILGIFVFVKGYESLDIRR